jgi:hypothetical protein
MTNRSSSPGGHPAGNTAVFDPAADQVVAVVPAGVGPRARGLPGTVGGPVVVPERGTPPLPTAEARTYRATHVSLLAATALGLAFASGATDGNARTLTQLVAPDADLLLEASTAVLELAVGPRRTRVLAAHLLGRAAVLCA